MTTKIYVEGGGNNKDTRVRCRQGFAQYCNKIAPYGRRPMIVVCGGRHQAFERFRTETEQRNVNERCALLVDSEAPVAEHLTAAIYLQNREGWKFVHLPHDAVFLMVQAMEAWLLADRAAVATYYGSNFHFSALPGDERHIEAIPKNDLESSLVKASAASTKGTYHKTKHAFDLLATIDPLKVEAGSEHARNFHVFLRSL